MQRRLLLNVVVIECPSIFELFACENQALLVGRDSRVHTMKRRNNQRLAGLNLPLLILNLRLDIVDSVRRLNLEGDCLSRQCLHEDLHLSGGLERLLTRCVRNCTVPTHSIMQLQSN
jgi:hypothetical protein